MAPQLRPILVGFAHASRIDYATVTYTRGAVADGNHVPRMVSWVVDTAMPCIQSCTNKVTLILQQLSHRLTDRTSLCQDSHSRTSLIRTAPRGITAAMGSAPLARISASCFKLFGPVEELGPPFSIAMTSSTACEPLHVYVDSQRPQSASPIAIVL